MSAPPWGEKVKIAWTYVTNNNFLDTKESREQQEWINEGSPEGVHYTGILQKDAKGVVWVGNAPISPGDLENIERISYGGFRKKYHRRTKSKIGSRKRKSKRKHRY